jgi:hypothetical protein
VRLQPGGRTKIQIPRTQLIPVWHLVLGPCFFLQGVSQESKLLKVSVTFRSQKHPRRQGSPVVPKKSLTGDNTERVDTRVLQIIRKVDHDDPGLFAGTQVRSFQKKEEEHENTKERKIEEQSSFSAFHDFVVS